MKRRTLIAAILLSALGVAAYAQNQIQAAVATKDPTAASLVSNALKVMTPGAQVTDITISAQVVRNENSDSETGPVTLEALSAGDASLTYALSGGQRSEIVNPSSNPPGAWSGTDGVWHGMALHNTWTPAAWFAPALVLEEFLNDPSLTIVNLGQTSLNGEAVQHLRSWRTLTSTSGAPADLAIIQSLSTVDIYIDLTSNLPVALNFNLHPDSNAGVNIPVQILYSNWQSSSGMMLPFHVQRFFNGNLLDDISVSTATVNSGLSPSAFNVPATSGGVQ
jgi:hypothetical protein